MTTEEIKQKLFSSDSFVREELKRVQTLYELKRVIRYKHTRSTEQHTESVAEHIYGMHCLMDYFLPLENPHGDWNQVRIQGMIQYHDIDEIITGDEIGYRKSDDAHLAERSAAEEVINNLPTLTRSTVRSLLDEYEAQLTPEAKFVKAIDKIEPIFHLYNQTGKNTLARLKTTKEQHDRIKYPAVNAFPILKRFTDVMTEQFDKEGFYHNPT